MAWYLIYAYVTVQFVTCYLESVILKEPGIGVDAFTAWHRDATRLGVHVTVLTMSSDFLPPLAIRAGPRITNSTNSHWTVQNHHRW
jgi:hypothetical protein